jgi:hypothetical protein
MNTTYRLIREAILNKLQIVATYGGHVRQMCPHMLGTKAGREQALFYQFGGTSSSGPIVANSPDNWRCMPIEGLRNVILRPGPWHSGPRHLKTQTCLDEVDVDVDVEARR